MSKPVQLLLVGLGCFLLGCLLAQRLPLVHGQEAAKKPTWLHGLDLNVRKGGELDFSKAQKIGVEVFRDENNGNLIYISETGAIAVTQGK